MPAQPNPSELLIRQRMNALTRALPGARQGNPALVHQARVASRRLREALPLVAPGSKGRKLERAARRLTRALGPVRELDVALEMLEGLTAGSQAPRGAIARLKQMVREERQRIHAEMCSRVDRVDVGRLRRRAASAAAKGSRARGNPKRVAGAQLRAARRGVRLREAIESAAGLYLPDRLHQVRIAVKKLRYAIEVSRELSGSRAVARLRTLKEAQDLLGRLHDHEVLITRVRGIQGSTPNLRLSGDLDTLVRRLETEARQIHGQYMALRKKLLAIADAAATPRARRAPAA
jgi:CHAD domain-containing protein